MLGHPTPNEDAEGERFAFEKGAKKLGGEDGWADVWKKDHFAWEYKGKHKDLVAALQQLLQYHGDLDTPPLLVVSDMDRFEVRTFFTGLPSRTHRFTLKELADNPEEPLRILRAVFFTPEDLK